MLFLGFDLEFYEDESSILGEATTSCKGRYVEVGLRRGSPELLGDLRKALICLGVVQNLDCDSLSQGHNGYLGIYLGTAGD